MQILSGLLLAFTQKPYQIRINSKTKTRKNEEKKKFGVDMKKRMEKKPQQK